MNIRQVVFVSAAGLRGSLSLILVQTIIKLAPNNTPTEEAQIQAVGVPVTLGGHSSKRRVHLQTWLGPP